MKVIVVGASSGIGAAILKQLRARGDDVVGVARRAGDDKWITHDVRKFGETRSAFESALALLGGLDAIYYVSGVMEQIPPGEFDFEKDQVMIDTNLTGAIGWCNLAAAYFQKQQRGVIVGVGSVAGERGRAARPVYHASKAGLHTYLESLRNRLAGMGVRVVTVKPGPIDTPMTVGAGLKNMLSADEAARRIIQLANGSSERFLRWHEAIGFTILKMIPSPIFRRLKI